MIQVHTGIQVMACVTPSSQNGTNWNIYSVHFSCLQWQQQHENKNTNNTARSLFCFPPCFLREMDEQQYQHNYKAHHYGFYFEGKEKVFSIIILVCYQGFRSVSAMHAWTVNPVNKFVKNLITHCSEDLFLHAKYFLICFPSK